MVSAGTDRHASSRNVGVRAVLRFNGWGSTGQVHTPARGNGEMGFATGLLQTEPILGEGRTLHNERRFPRTRSAAAGWILLATDY